MVERFDRSLKYEHLYRVEIDTADELAHAAHEFIEIYNCVRPHEYLDFRRPLDVHRGI